MKLLLGFLYIILCSSEITSTVLKYHGYKVYDVIPKNDADLKYLDQFRGNNHVDFWSKHRIANKSTHIMVSPVFQNLIESALKSHNIKYGVLIPDVEKTIERSTLRSQSVTLKDGDVSFTKYMRHAEINAYLNKLARIYPNIVSTEIIGKSYEGRNITLIKIGTGGSNKPIIFADGGIHAREWLAPATVLYIINQLVENSANSELYKNVDWALLPVANPDGYEYTFTTERFWRKTRSWGSKCYGTDANRNFGFHWGESGADHVECSDIYAGNSSFSESETRAMRDYFKKYEKNLKLYVAVHSYGNYLIYPYSYTNVLPDNADELQRLGDDVGDSIRAINGTKYSVGNSAAILYPAAGCSDDFAKGASNISLAYTIELSGGGSDGFNPPETDILRNVQETWPGFKTFHKYVENKYKTA